MTEDAGPGPRWALLLLDFQHDFLRPSGRMPVASGQVGPVLAAATVVVDLARTHRGLTVKVGNEFPARQVVHNVLRRGAARAGSLGAT